MGQRNPTPSAAREKRRVLHCGDWGFRRGCVALQDLEQETDWTVLTTINAPRWPHVTGDEMELWLAGSGEVDTAALQAFFYECDLGAQLKFLRGRRIPVERALVALDRHIRAGFPRGFRFPLDDWAA